MLLSEPDRKRVDRDALTFANLHRDHQFGRDFRRSDIVKAAEASSDDLPEVGRSDDRELAVLWRFSSQVFKHLDIDVRIA